MDLGKKISQIRKDKKIKIDELVELSGVPKGTLNKILTGITKDPQLETLKSIAKALGCTLDDFDEDSNIGSYSYEEKEIIYKYRSLDSISKESINNSLSFEYEQTQKRSSEKTDTFHLTEEEQDFLMKFREIKDVDVRVLSRMLNSMYDRKDRERASGKHTDGKEA